MVGDFRITLEGIHDCYLLCNDLVLNFLLFACTMDTIYKIKLHKEEDKRIAKTNACSFNYYTGIQNQKLWN